jgi:hypothetical protein
MLRKIAFAAAVVTAWPVQRDIRKVRSGRLELIFRAATLRVAASRSSESYPWG